MSELNPRTVVIGLGNPLMGDDGLGLRALERLRQRGVSGAAIDLVDGGTWGMRLLPVLEEADAVILLDAIDDGRPPGTLIVLECDHVPARIGHKLSAHETDLRDVFALLALRGTLPERLVAIGLQPERVELGAPVSDVVESGLGTVVATTLARLAAWGLRVDAPEPAVAV